MRQDEIVKFVNEFFKEVSVYAKQVFNVNIGDTKLLFDFKNETPTAWATAYRINKSIRFRVAVLLTREAKHFIEYKAFKGHQGIASCAVSGNEEWLKVLICHEAAHIVQRELVKSRRGFDHYSPAIVAEMGHKRAFRYIYRLIRSYFIGPKEFVTATFCFDEPIRRVLKLDVKHPAFGKTVRIDKRDFIVTGYVSSAKKYKFRVSDGSTNYKITQKQLENWMI